MKKSLERKIYSFISNHSATYMSSKGQALGGTEGQRGPQFLHGSADPSSALDPPQEEQNRCTALHTEGGGPGGGALKSSSCVSVFSDLVYLFTY